MFSTFSIDELPEESENDYAVEITTSESKLGLLVTEDELECLGHAMLDTAKGGVENMQEGSVQELVE